MPGIAVRIEEELAGLDEDSVRRALEAVLRLEGADLNLSVALVDDRRIHDVNRRFLNHDYPTDVISFDLRDASDALEGSGEDSHAEDVDAELIVSVTTARREAAERSLDPVGEALLYCIHGTLHLLGYDDHQDADRERMHARQTEILQSLGYETAS